MMVSIIKKFEAQRICQLTSSDGNTVAKLLPERGGLLYSLTMQGKQRLRELLYVEKDFWHQPNHQLIGGMPICFPICGRLQAINDQDNYHYSGHDYYLPMHGFVRNMPWKIVDQGASDRLLLTVTDTEHTFKQFPFRFELRFEYQVENNKLRVKQTYINRDDRSLPLYAGFHPYFLTPPAHQGKEKVFIHFNAKKHLLYNPDLTAIIDEKPPLLTPISVSSHQIKDELMLLDANNQVDIIYPGGDRLVIYTQSPTHPELFRYLQLYTQVDAPFICAEHWMSRPNALNEDNGVLWLARGNLLEATYVMALT